jgi:hypothetical protein
MPYLSLVCFAVLNHAAATAACTARRCNVLRHVGRLQQVVCCVLAPRGFEVAQVGLWVFCGIVGIACVAPHDRGVLVLSAKQQLHACLLCSLVLLCVSSCLFVCSRVALC